MMKFVICDVVVPFELKEQPLNKWPTKVLVSINTWPGQNCAYDIWCHADDKRNGNTFSVDEVFCIKHLKTRRTNDRYNWSMYNNTNGKIKPKKATNK